MKTRNLFCPKKFRNITLILQHTYDTVSGYYTMTLNNTFDNAIMYYNNLCL